MRAASLLLLAALAGCTPAADPAVPAAPVVAVTGPDDVEVPAGMAYVPGGTVHVGSTAGRPDEAPVFAAEAGAFLLDRSPVTVARFRRFVEETGYATQAERFGTAGVMDMATGGWAMVDGADWRRPEGPAASAAPDDHPVTQVSWHDAAAFCAWDGKRLPTEVEWEHAARGGRDARERYAWGRELGAGAAARANTWTGTFPRENTAADGFLKTSPVGHYGETALGLTDLGGNVWEWTADWYRPYDQRDAPFTPTPASERAQRGGSFLCHPSYCHGYRVSGRSHSTPETSLFHVGFRCARDIG